MEGREGRFASLALGDGHPGLVFVYLLCLCVHLSLRWSVTFTVTLLLAVLGRTVEHLKKELQQKGDIGLVAEVFSSIVSFSHNFFVTSCRHFT